MNRLRLLWRRHIVERHRIPAPLWQSAVSQLRIVSALEVVERQRLHDLASRFLRAKTIVGAHDLEVTDEMRVSIAAQACLLILNLGLDYYTGWYEVIVYARGFLVDAEEYDDAGVVHRHAQELDGEAWESGPVILSWQDARPGARPHGEGSNVVLHEFAHKLDMLNGAANGMPPLHENMSRPEWTEALSSAYRDLNERLDQNRPTDIDPYAAESPAEFFAVLTELFFEAPRRLFDAYPRVYHAFMDFYLQDPMRRIGR